MLKKKRGRDVLGTVMIEVAAVANRPPATVALNDSLRDTSDKHSSGTTAPKRVARDFLRVKTNLAGHLLQPLAE